MKTNTKSVLDQEDNEVDMILDVDESNRKLSRQTKWRNPPSLHDLKQDLTDALSSHSDHIADVERWLDNLEGTGSAAPKKRLGRSSIVPKVIKKQAEWRYTSLSEPFLSTEDVFNVSPVTYEDKAAADQNRLLLNYQFNTKINKVDFFDTYVRTAVDEGTVILKVGWRFEEEEQWVEEPVMGMRMVEDPAQAEAMLAAGMEPFEEVQIGTEEVKKMVTTVNHPTVEVVEYSNVIIDPTCGGVIDKANFIIMEFDTSLSELTKDGRYSNLEGITADGETALSYTDSDVEKSGFSFADKPRKVLKAYEYWGYWDIDGTGIVKPIVATWVGGTLIRLEENPFPDKKLPFIRVQYLPKRFSIYGEPDGALIEDNQKIIGAVTRGMIDIMARSANGQIGTAKNVLDIGNKRKFMRGEDYEFNPTDTHPEHAFYMHKYPEIPQSAQYMVDKQTNDADALTGIKSFTDGISGASLGTTATGVRSAMDAASKRELGILRRMAEGIKQVGRKFMSMNAVFLNDEEVVRVTNQEFVTIRRDDLAGYYDINLSISTAEADNEKAQELSFMLQTLGNNLPEELTRMIMIDIAELRKMPTLAQNLREYQPQPDPVQQKKQELEIAQLEQEIAKTQAETSHLQALAQLEIAKIDTEKAKTRGLISKADKDDLEYVEQESGTTHERELDKQRQKHMGEAELKAVDADVAERQQAKPPKVEDLAALENNDDFAGITEI